MRRCWVSVSGVRFEGAQLASGTFLRFQAAHIVKPYDTITLTNWTLASTTLHDTNPFQLVDFKSVS